MRLELRYLYAIKRITADADVILADLSNRIGLQVSDKDLNAVIGHALEISRTRDPFDRIITVQASLDHASLISSDKNILCH